MRCSGKSVSSCRSPISPTGRHRFLAKAPEMASSRHHDLSLKNANQALADLRAGRFDGAAVLVPEPRFDPTIDLPKPRMRCEN